MVIIIQQMDIRVFIQIQQDMGTQPPDILHFIQIQQEFDGKIWNDVLRLQNTSYNSHPLEIVFKVYKIE
jgi:hypothetical protein